VDLDVSDGGKNGQELIELVLKRGQALVRDWPGTGFRPAFPTSPSRTESSKPAPAAWRASTTRCEARRISPRQIGTRPPRTRLRFYSPIPPRPRCQRVSTAPLRKPGSFHESQFPVPPGRRRGNAPPAAPLRESRRYNGGADMNGANSRRVWDAWTSGMESHNPDEHSHLLPPPRSYRSSEGLAASTVILWPEADHP